MRPPIADPFGPPASFAEESRVFRRSFWRTYVAALFLALVMVPLMGTYFWFSTPQMFSGSNRIALAMMLVSAVVVNPLAGALGAFLYPVKVTRIGIYGPPSAGFVEWEQMKSVRTLWLGHPWVRIGLRKRFVALWVPLALHDLQGFARTLEEWAPADNPLRVWAQRGL